MPASLGHEELLLIAASAIATLSAQRLLSQCCGSPSTAYALSQRRLPSTEEIRPPFPPEVVALLRSCALCYLSTVADGSPHLSLMNFTYCQQEEKIIMSTRRDTLKFTALLSLPRVALLMHDFPDQHSSRTSEEKEGVQEGASSSRQQLREDLQHHALRWRHGGDRCERGAAACAAPGATRAVHAAVHLRGERRDYQRGCGQGSDLQRQRSGHGVECACLAD
jgi:hypothetical protein